MLSPETEKAWNFLKEQPALAGFVLIGGSALAMTISHRLSEDLDFIYPDVRLPVKQLEALRREAHERGFQLQRDDDEAALQEFARDGLDLHNYQQDFRAHGAVKISFFAPDESLRRIFASDVRRPKVRVATLAEIFKAKCLVSAIRSKTRDWLDLYLLMRDHGFSIRDYQAAFQTTGLAVQCDIGLARLCGGMPQRDDEGYAHLLKNPPTLEEMKTFFAAQRDKLEVELAAEARRKNPE